MKKRLEKNRSSSYLRKDSPPFYFKMFAALVILPGVILSLIALRTINRETIFIEKQLKDNLSIELNNAVSVTENVLGQLKLDLDSLVSGTDFYNVGINSDPAVKIVSVPFKLSEKRDIITPVYRVGLTRKELEFFKYNQDFFQDRTPIPVYKNIAVAFADEFEEKKSALSKFKQDKEIQKKIYDQVATSNMKIAKRNIKPLSKSGKNEKFTEELSEYVTESLSFSQIISGKSSGIIPRLIDERMMLLYWKKNINQEIIGCVININALKKRLIEALPQSHTDVRIMTLIDQTGVPIISLSNKDTTHWKQPFVSQEVNELLPGWEAGAYLSNPESVRDRGRLTAIIIGCLVLFLLLSLIIGSLIVIRAMNAQLLLAQQKTTFVANVSHELKTPLTSIRLFAELLKEQRQTDPVKEKKYLSIMVSETERLTRLINNVLDFSRSDKGEKKYNMEKTDIVELVLELVDSQRDRLEHNGFTVTIEPYAGALFVNSDNESIKQVLINLLSNAEKYSLDTRSVTVRFVKEVAQVSIEIEDRGIGIRSDSMKYIFDEFYRVDDSLTSNVSGTGLGLTISKRIVEDHGGSIYCRTAKPNGTIFSFTLPLTS